jgi:hypothetical protein
LQLALADEHQKGIPSLVAGGSPREVFSTVVLNAEAYADKVPVQIPILDCWVGGIEAETTTHNDDSHGIDNGADDFLSADPRW